MEPDPGLIPTVEYYFGVVDQMDGDGLSEL